MNSYQEPSDDSKQRYRNNTGRDWVKSPGQPGLPLICGKDFGISERQWRLANGYARWYDKLLARLGCDNSRYT